MDALLNPSPPVTLPSSVYENLTHQVLNTIEAAVLTGEEHERYEDEEAWRWSVVERFLELGVENVVLTLAREGAYYATAEG